MDFNEFKHRVLKNDTSFVYLFAGPEIGDKKEALNLFKKNIFKNNDPLIYTYYAGSDLSPADLLDAVQTQPLFSNEKLIVVKNIEKVTPDLSKTLTSLLIPDSIDKDIFETHFSKRADIFKKISEYYTLKGDRYCISKIKEADKKKIVELFVTAGYSPLGKSTFLILVNETTDEIPEAVTRLIADSQSVMFFEMFENKKLEWIRAEFKKNDIYIEDNAVAFLLETIENNKNELELIISNISVSLKEHIKTTGDKPVVTKDFIEDHLYHSKEESPFSLFNAMLQLNAEKALEILKKLFTTDRDSILPGLIWSQRRLVKMIDLYENMKHHPNDIFKEMFITRKKMIQELSVIFGRFNFKHAVYNYRKMAELEYYMRAMPRDLKYVKFQEMIVLYINGNIDKSFLQGQLQYIQF